MSREKMMDNVIKKFGFEHDFTIWFCKLCEKEISDIQVRKFYTKLMER